MKSLVNDLVKPFLTEEKKEVVALYAGGFKPPTSGHLLVVEEALKRYPEIDKFYVVVGTGVRDEIDQEESLLVWEIYQNYLPMKVEIMPAKKPAIGEVYSYAKEHPDQTIYWVIGGREGREDDLNDIAIRTRALDKAEDKYNNVEVKIVTTPDANMSGTNARKALLANDQEAFYKFLPARVKEKEEIFTILRPAALNEDMSFEKKRELIKKIVKLAQSSGEHVSVDRLADMIARKISIDVDSKPLPGSFKVIGGKPFVENLNEHSMGNSIDLLPYLAKLTQHMIDKGYNIEPLPGLTLIDDDISNAEDFFGKTAYYDPNEQNIVLYTHGRHPKDIARSYAHEMIHHIQNLEDRLGDITTTNTQEDDRLNDLEAEANLKGTMTFRNWTDSLEEKKNKDPFGLNAYALELAKGLEEEILNEGVYDSLITRLSRDVINTWVAQFKKDPKRIFALLDKNYEEEDAKGRPMEFDLLAKIDFKKTKDRQYKVDGGANAGDEDNEGFVALTFQVDPRDLPRMWSTIAMDIRDVLRHEVEHLTQSGYNVRAGKEMADDQFIRDLIQKYKTLAPKNYFMLDKEVDAMLQGMYYKAKKTRTPFGDVLNDYLDKVGLEPEEKEEIKNRWRGRVKALSLPLFEEEEVMNYVIYSDMDGVLSDFDKRFMQFSDGIPPGQYEQRKGKEAFWDLIDNQVGVPFWAGMDWMSDGKQYWDYIKKYNPIILSAPSKNEESKYGKRIWKKRNMPSNKMILVPAWKKQEYAAPNAILIDDRADNINQWEAAGGIGILHTDAASTIAKLKELGL